MKIRIIPAVVFVAATLPLAAQTAQPVQEEQRTGVSTPEPVAIDADNDAAATPGRHPLKPSAAKTEAPAAEAAPATVTPATAKEEAYGPYVPYTGTQIASTQKPASGDVDSQIVTSVPEREGEINEGTLLRVRMKDQLSTAETKPGAIFGAEIMEAVTHKGRVIIPIGATLEGTVTSVHEGHRISGVASMHLEPQRIVLPDGTMYGVRAQLIDTTLSSFAVDREGTLKRRDRTKETLGVGALTTGGGAVAGAMVGGGVGALVGAGIGAGVTTVMWSKQDRQATLDKDSRLVFSLTAPMDLKPVRSGMAMTAPSGAVNGGGSE